MKFTTPAVASDPYNVDPDPFNTSTTANASTGTGTSIFKLEDCTLFNRIPFHSTSVCPNDPPRIDNPLCIAPGARSRKSSDASKFSKSEIVPVNGANSRAGIARTARSASSNGIGSKTPVTTTVTFFSSAIRGNAATNNNRDNMSYYHFTALDSSP